MAGSGSGYTCAGTLVSAGPDRNRWKGSDQGGLRPGAWTTPLSLPYRPPTSGLPGTAGVCSQGPDFVTRGTYTIPAGHAPRSIRISG